MTVNSVTPPYVTFKDTDGTALDAGYIYIGEPGLNAEANRKAAFWDAELTIPAGQPIRTSGGFAVYEGSPGRLFTDGEYSIVIKNRAGELVQSLLSSLDQTTGDVPIFETVAEMKASFLEVGQYVETQGYLAPGDGGGAQYEIVASGTGVDDGGAFHDLTNVSAQAKLLYSQSFKAEWWGVVLGTDGLAKDRTNEFNAAFAFVADLSRSERSDPEVNLMFTCDADFLASNTLHLRKSNDSNCEVDVVLTGRVTATTGGGFESQFGGTFVSGGVPVTTSASTPALPLFNVRCRRSQVTFAEIDCNFICSGIRYQGAGGTTCYGQDMYHFRDYGHLVLSRSNNALVLRWNNVKQWLLDSEDAVDFDGRMASGGNTNQNNYTGNCAVVMQKDHRYWGGHWGWSRSAILLMDQYPNRDTYGEDKYYDGLSSEANFTETATGTGDVMLYGLHLMQGFGGNATSPRYDNVDIGGPIGIECHNSSNAAYAYGCDFDACTIQMFGNALRISPSSIISGGENKFPDDSGNDANRVIVIDPRLRIYADGSNNPSQAEMHGVPGLTVGVFNRSGYTSFNGSYKEWNLLNQPDGGVGTLEFQKFLAFDSSGRDDRGLTTANCALKMPTSSDQNDLYVVVQDMDVLTDNSVVLQGSGGTVSFSLNRGDYVICTASFTGNTAGDWIPGSLVRAEYGDVISRSNAYEAHITRKTFQVVGRGEAGDPVWHYFKPSGDMAEVWDVAGSQYEVDYNGNRVAFRGDGVDRFQFDSPARMANYTVATLPTTNINSGCMAYCTDETGGAVPVFYDGTDWRRVTDRAIAT